MKTVILMPTGYKWLCRNCGEVNVERGGKACDVKDVVKCTRCGVEFKTDLYI